MLSNQIDNMIDIIVNNETPLIRKIIMNNDLKSKEIFNSRYLNEMASIMHKTHGYKDIPIYGSDILQNLKQCYWKEINNRQDNNFMRLKERNQLDIYFQMNSLRYKYTYHIDHNFNLLSEKFENFADFNDNKGSIVNILKLNCYTIPLTNTNILIGKKKFIDIIQKLPLIEYMASLETSEINQCFVSLKQVKYNVSLFYFYSIYANYLSFLF